MCLRRIHPASAGSRPRHTVGRIDELALSGKTDLQFICDAFVVADFMQNDIRERLPEVNASYLREIERFNSNGG